MVRPIRLDPVDPERGVKCEGKAKELIKNPKLNPGAALQESPKHQGEEECSNESANGERCSLRVEQNGEHQLIVAEHTAAMPKRQGCRCRSQLSLLFLQLVEPPEDVGQQQFVLQIDLVIKVRPQPVLMGLPILGHHNDWRLQCGNHVEGQIQQSEWKRIKRPAGEEDGIC